jgi:hypothetical protein
MFSNIGDGTLNELSSFTHYKEYECVNLPELQG